MPQFDYEIDIPFAENTGRRCVPACTEMIANTLLPDKNIGRTQAETLSGFREGYSTWATQHLLSLNELGLEVGWIQDEDLLDFSRNPELYIRQQISNDESYNQFLQTNDLQREAARVREYFQKQLAFEQRLATNDDIRERALGGYVVRLEVNGEVLAGHTGYTNHAVLISGFNDEIVRVENPDSKYGSKPKQLITWNMLEQSWQVPTLQYYKFH